jgi:hypothetical protein
MKLYAITTSENGKPVGKGGNRQLEISLTIDPIKRKEIGKLILRYGEKGEGEHEGYTIFYYPINENCREQKINSGRVLLYQEKG